jgi:DNA-directed RNA polymerase specialized sigma24 family protein
MRGRVIQYFRDKSRLIRLPDNRRVDHADLPHVTASLDASETDWEGWARLGVHDLNLDHLVLKLAIGKLKPDYRAIIRLIYLQQCSQVSVARILH